MSNTNGRAELIKELRLLAQISGGKLVTQAADMLEADTLEINRLEQCRIDEAKTTNKASQASRDLLPKVLNEEQQLLPLRECLYESPALKICRKCGQRHDKSIFSTQGD